MQLEELDALMAESAIQFNELKVEEGVIRNRLETIDTGLKRLQGEHEAYQKLRDALLARTSQSLDAPNSANMTDGDPATVTPDPFKSKLKERAINAAN